MIHNTTPFSSPNKTTTTGSAFWHLAAAVLLGMTPVAMTTWGQNYTGMDMMRDGACAVYSTIDRAGVYDCPTGKLLTIR